MSGWDLGSALVALLVGFGVGFWSYRRLPVRLSGLVRGALITLRSLVVASLLWLLAEPLLRLVRANPEKATIVLIADDTQSLFFGGQVSPLDYGARIEAIAARLEAAGYAVEKRLLDRQLRPWGPPSGAGSGTALYQGLIEARQTFPQAEAIVLFSDGMDNASLEAAPRLGVPVWTVGVGPSVPMDAAIEGVVIPSWWEARRAYEVGIRLVRLTGPATLVIQTPTEQRSWPVNAGTRILQVSLSFPEAGFFPITFRLEMPNDPNPSNNFHTEVVSVRPSTPRIALWAGEITPDIGYLRRTLERIGPVTPLLPKKPSGFTTSPDTLTWKAYAIHVLYNFPARPEDTLYLRRILDAPGVPWTVWGSTVLVSLTQPYLRRLGWESLGPLRSQSLGGEATLLLRTEFLAPTAEKLSGPWGPWAYRFVLGNKAAAGLLGEGWWHLRSTIREMALLDSLVAELGAWSLLFYQTPSLILPRRSRYALSEAVEWTGEAPTATQLLIRRPKGKVDTLRLPAPPSYKPSEAGLHTYTLVQGSEALFTGAFWVEAASPELTRLGIDTLTLRYIAAQNRGQYLPWDSLEALPAPIMATIPSQTLVHLHSTVIPLHEWWPWLALLLGLLCTEWLLRRYWGLY